MGFYTEHLLPRLQDKVMSGQSTRVVRERVCADLRGTVLEVGFGTGLNTTCYPPDVVKVVAIEPSAVCMRLAEPRIETAAIPIEYGGLTGEHLDLPDASFDTVLSTWTLCTIPNLEAALAELRRVLRPGGRLHFVEHGHSPEEKVARFQARLEPLNKRIFGGCHLTRNIADEIERSGFAIEKIETYYSKGEPKATGYTYEGQAVSR
jgi:ubiquinone/menaquinone biosynthesis C-methylase UbiE